MPATPARIGFITQEFRIATASDAAVQSLYGQAARKDDEARETYFVNMSDAEAVADQRIAILSARRRIMSSIVPADDIGLTYRGTIPRLRVIDDERAYDATASVFELSTDHETGQTRIVTGG